MHFVLSTIGSLGDALPFISIAAALRKRGHSAVLLANPFFAGAAEKAGVPLHPLGDVREYLDLAESPELWHPVRGVKAIAAQWWLPNVPRVIEYVREHRTAGTVLIGSVSSPGMRIAQELFQLPLHTVVLSPFILPSIHVPGVSPGFSPPEWSPLFFRAAFNKFTDSALNRIFSQRLNQQRACLDLPPIRGNVRSWWVSPESIVCLFPEWFAPPQPDWPAATKLTNFVLPESRSAQLSPSVQKQLHGSRPIAVFTMGSVLNSGQELFRALIMACSELGITGVILTSNRHAVPSPVPHGIHHVEFLPLSDILPQSGVIVHHGGIGTAAAAIAAGTPQIVIPHGHDQFDNAVRLRRTGVATVLKARSMTVSKARGILTDLLANKAMAARCMEAKDQYRRGPDIDSICQLFETTIHAN